MHPGLRFRTICVDRSRRVFRGNSMTRYRDREEIAEYFSTTIVLASVQRQHGFSAPFQCSTYQAYVGHPSVGGSHRFEDLLRSLIYSACYLLQKQLFLRQEVCTTLTTLQICFWCRIANQLCSITFSSSRFSSLQLDLRFRKNEALHRSTP